MGISKSYARVVERISWGGEIFMMLRTAVRVSPKTGMKIPSQRSQCVIGSSDLMNRFYVVSENARSRNFGRVADWPHGKDIIFGSKDDRQSGSTKICPEKKLAVAVFSQAANDLQKFRQARRGARYSFYADARKWIASNDRSWPYSFLNLCDALNLAADIVRAELLGNRVPSSFSRDYKKMKAAQVSKPGGDLELVECEIPNPSGGQVRVKVEACGIC